VRVGKLCSFRRGGPFSRKENPADAVFHLQAGKVKLAVVSKTGKEATIGILSDKSFFGEGSLAGQAFAWARQRQ
jgi:CRP-like cAMP-binding protein